MSKPLLIVLIAALVGLGAGAAYLLFRAPADAAARDGEAVVKVGETHEISLDSNATTGYTWTAKFDEAYLELVKKRYDAPSSSALGAPGKDVFTFRGLKKGKTTVTFEYARPWEETVEKAAVYELQIE